MPRTRNLFRLLPALLLALAACRDPKPAEEASASEAPVALAVSVEPARAERLARAVSATGNVAAWQELTVSAELSGLAIVEIPVQEGDRVAQGQLLARLDDRALQAQIAEQQAAIDQAQATLDNAELVAARSRRMLAAKAISQETADQNAATARTSRAALAQAQAALQALQVQLEQTRITAPVAGVVAAKPAVLGTVVQSGTELVQLIRDGRLEVQARVPERDLAAIRPGQAVSVTDAAGAVTPATVRAAAEKVDATTRLGTVYADLPAGTALKAGMFARVSIAVEGGDGLTVPEAALVWRQGQPQVFTVDADGAARLRPVRTGSRGAGRVTIEDGLAQGERVVTAGAGFLDDGSRVRIAETLTESGR
ncbi:efflux RND transporter periplasmic adaptor subunit [Inquilinus sp. OTU3971]|uniref:efflux RND transporter periplasmic adaptor subunit n=1 Tax=Inquilinus sp. OTU3971 TaxID=3043855 RepID=UPI00313A8867